MFGTIFVLGTYWDSPLKFYLKIEEWCLDYSLSFPTEQVSYFSCLTELLALVKTLLGYSKFWIRLVSKTDPILMTFPQ